MKNTDSEECHSVQESSFQTGETDLKDNQPSLSSDNRNDIGKGASAIENEGENCPRKELTINLNSILAPEKAFELVMEPTNEEPLIEKSTSMSLDSVERTRISETSQINSVDQPNARHETENKKQKLVINLRQPEAPNQRCKETVGDDPNRRHEQSIVCECTLNVEGDAVPTVASIENTAPRNDTNDGNTIKEPAITGRTKVRSARTSKVVKSRDTDKIPNGKSDAKPASQRCVRLQRNTNASQTNVTKNADLQKTTSSSCVKLSFESLCDSRSSLDRPSLIPKPCPKISSQKYGGMRESALEKSNAQRTSSVANIRNISSKTCNLAATTTLIRSKLDACGKPKNNVHFKERSDPENTVSSDNSNLLRRLFSKIIAIKKTAKELSSITLMSRQKQHIERMLSNISDIQKITEKLNGDIEFDAGVEKDIQTNGPEDSTEASPNKSNDKKGYVKPSSAKENRKRSTDSSPSPKEPPLRPESPISQMTMSEPTECDQTLVHSDSLDGVFIPSVDPPIIGPDEEDEPSGLDITINFPEFRQFLNNESELSVRVSEISSGTLKKLKRCPKDFTLRMDFIQGKVLLQARNLSADNNLTVEPNLTSFDRVDHRRSDVISLKPSTDCCFTSQLIPVQTLQDLNPSHRSLKATESALLDIVRAPHLYRNPPLDAITRSCISFDTNRPVSMAIVALPLNRSLPHIRSMSNLYETRIQYLKSVFQIQEKKVKNRSSIKRGPGSTTRTYP